MIVPRLTPCINVNAIENAVNDADNAMTANDMFVNFLGPTPLSCVRAPNVAIIATKPPIEATIVPTGTD